MFHKASNHERGRSTLNMGAGKANLEEVAGRATAFVIQAAHTLSNHAAFPFPHNIIRHMHFDFHHAKCHGLPVVTVVGLLDI
ncbi:MAG: hypothetical protein WAM90_05235 [Rhodanobacter sp.]